MPYKRLKFIASLINENDRVLDVGTDHALIPIFLHKKFPNIKIDVSDINKNPLNVAKKNIEKVNLQEKINLFLSNGVSNIDIDGYNVIIIAGFGGLEISKIITQKNYKGKYILQPTNNFNLLKKTLKKNNFKIFNEFLIKEKNVFNIIIISEKRNLKNYFYLNKNKNFWKKENSEVDEYLIQKLNHYNYLYNKSKNFKYKKYYKNIKRKIKWREKKF